MTSSARSRPRWNGGSAVFEPDGNEPEYAELTWDDGVDFEELDCVEIDMDALTLSDEEWDELTRENWNGN